MFAASQGEVSGEVGWCHEMEGRISLVMVTVCAERTKHPVTRCLLQV